VLAVPVLCPFLRRYFAPNSRRPVDPPIILQVHSTNPARDYPEEFLESVSFFTRAHLVAVSPVEGGLVKKADVPAEVMHAGGEWWKRVKGPKGGEPIAGEELVGGEKMADPDGRSASSPFCLACIAASRPYRKLARALPESAC